MQNSYSMPTPVDAVQPLPFFELLRVEHTSGLCDGSQQQNFTPRTKSTPDLARYHGLSPPGAILDTDLLPYDPKHQLGEEEMPPRGLRPFLRSPRYQGHMMA